MKIFQAMTLAILTLALIGIVPAIAQEQPEELLESGVYKEEVEGNLEGAIEIYKNIINEFSQNRSVAAQALLRLGSSYEKLGNQRAEDAYQRLIREFGDQREMASEAKLRLQRIRYEELASGVEIKEAGPTYRMVLDEDTPEMDPTGPCQFDFSPNGDRVVYQGQDGIYVSDNTGTINRRLVAHDQEGWNLIYFREGQPRWAPDGKQIAYMAHRRRPQSDDPNDIIFAIFLIDSDRGEPRPITPSLDPHPQGGPYWTPDGKGLSYLNIKGIHTLDLDGNVIKTIDVGAIRSTRFLEYSPDGKWLTFQERRGGESDSVVHSTVDEIANSDIFLVPSDGGKKVWLTDTPGFDGNPTWSWDGRSIYYVSGHGNFLENSNIWKLRIDPTSGTPVGEPEQVTFFDDARIMHPRIVGEGRQIAFALGKKKNMVHVAKASHPEDYSTLARGTAPLLSPDGKTVYYRGGGSDQQNIFAVDAQGGKSRRLNPSTSLLGMMDLSPDGRTLSFFHNLDTELGLYTHSVSGGEPRLLTKTGLEDCCAWPQWSPDGQQIAYSIAGDLFVISSSGGHPTKLATLRSWEPWTLRWSPNGQYIAALGYQEGEGNQAVYVIPSDGGNPLRLSGFEDYKEGLEWHPNGQSLTYHISRMKSLTWRTWLDGSKSELFLDHPDAWDYVGVWAPDGKQFFFMGAKLKEDFLDVYDVKSKEITRIAYNAGTPTWSKDGSTMAWSTVNHIRQLWVMENFK